MENAQISILNGSGIAGVEQQEMLELQRSVFNVAYIGNAPAGNYFEKLYLYELTNKPATKAKLETYYNTKALDASQVPYGVNTNGMDFVIILGVGYSVE